MEKYIKNTLLITIAILVTLLTATFAGSRTAYARELSEEEKAELEMAVEKAFDKMEKENLGRLNLDLSEFNLTVESMHEYVSILRVMDRVRLRRTPVFRLGTHDFDAIYFYTPTKPFCYINPADIYDPYYDTPELKKKAGKATIKRNEIAYDPHYINEDNTLKKDLFEHDLKAVPENYQKILSKVKDGMSDLEKLLVIHDEYCALTTYPDESGKDENGKAKYDQFASSPISSLTTNASVCYAQSVLTYYLLRDADLECIRVGSFDMSHAWNMVKIDGSYYHVDTTWDNNDYENSDPSTSHIYFLRTDEEMENLNHTHDWVDETEIKDKDAPESPKEPGFKGYIFRGTNEPEDNYENAYRNFSYLNGRWYCLDYMQNEIVSYADLEGNDKNATKPITDEYILSVYGTDKALYLCTANKLYEYRPDTETLTTILTPDKIAPDSYFTSMVIALDEFRIRVFVNNEEKYENIAKSFPVADLETKPTNTPEPTKEPEITKAAEPTVQPEQPKAEQASDNKVLTAAIAGAAVILITVTTALIIKKRK